MRIIWSDASYQPVGPTTENFNAWQENVGLAIEVILRGGTSRRDKKRRRRVYRWSDEPLSPQAVAIIRAVAQEQIDHLITEQQYVPHLAEALHQQNIELHAEHISALQVERDKLITEEVGKLLRKLRNREDEELLIILAESL